MQHHLVAGIAEASGERAELLDIEIEEAVSGSPFTTYNFEVADTDIAGHFEIQARGEMQIAILVEQVLNGGS